MAEGGSLPVGRGVVGYGISGLLRSVSKVSWSQAELGSDPASCHSHSSVTFGGLLCLSELFSSVYVRV